MFPINHKNRLLFVTKWVQNNTKDKSVQLSLLIPMILSLFITCFLAHSRIHQFGERLAIWKPPGIRVKKKRKKVRARFELKPRASEENALSTSAPNLGFKTCVTFYVVLNMLLIWMSLGSIIDWRIFNGDLWKVYPLCNCKVNFTENSNLSQNW